jgi:hypothetical protein
MFKGYPDDRTLTSPVTAQRRPTHNEVRMNRLVLDPKLMKDPKDQPGAVAGFAAAQKRIGKDGYSGLKSPRQTRIPKGANRGTRCC